MSPPLRWAGSKRKLLPRLLPLWVASKAMRYVEPFVGSGAFFFAAAPNSAVLADANEDLMNTYRMLVESPEAVHDALACLPRDRDAYYRTRAVDPQSLEGPSRAARFIFLNRNCFNGLYRTNKKGEFNVPFSPAKCGETPTLASLRAAASVLGRAELYSGDFESIVEMVVRPGDFVYLDPPYAVGNRRVFTQYNQTTFGLADLERLSDLLVCIDAVGAKFVLSYALCAEALELFGGWQSMRVLTQRNIAGFSSSRRRSAELLVTNLARSDVA